MKHGIDKRAQGGAVRISARRDNGFLNIRVANDGPLLPAGWNMAEIGAGLAIVRARLGGLYGDKYRLSVQNRVPDGVDVTISLPAAVN